MNDDNNTRSACEQSVHKPVTRGAALINSQLHKLILSLLRTRRSRKPPSEFVDRPFYLAAGDVCSADVRYYNPRPFPSPPLQ